VALSNQGALARAPLRDTVCAISVGIVKGVPCLDLDYLEDSSAEVDMNVVMTGAGRFIEVQGTGEGATFGDDDLRAMMRLAKAGLRRIDALQRRLLAGSGLLPDRAG
jgi:ribonuclease PH